MCNSVSKNSRALHRELRLDTKLSLLLVPMVVIPILALGGFAYHKLHRLAVSQQESQIRSQLTWLARDFERMRATAQANIRLFANDVLVRKYLHTRDAELRYTLLLSPLLRLFRSNQQAFPKYREIRIVLPDGTEDVVQSTLKAGSARPCKAPEFMDTELHKIQAVSATGARAARTWAGVA